MRSGETVSNDFNDDEAETNTGDDLVGDITIYVRGVGISKNSLFNLLGCRLLVEPYEP